MSKHSEKAWAWWRKFGPNPVCLAPMAEINDLPWRLLMRKHNVKVCFTGMLNAAQWSQGASYQNKFFNTCDEDRPLIGQIAGSNHDQILNAAKDLAKYCDAVDVNLGCTQKIACRGQYGYSWSTRSRKETEQSSFSRNSAKK